MSPIFGPLKATIYEKIRNNSSERKHSLDDCCATQLACYYISPAIRKKLNRAGIHRNGQLYKAVRIGEIREMTSLSQDERDRIEAYIYHWVDSFYFIVSWW